MAMLLSSFALQHLMLTPSTDKDGNAAIEFRPPTFDAALRARIYARNVSFYSKSNV
jgi:hypothetical protein